MLKFGNKEFRDLEEQVRKNQSDIERLQTGVKVQKSITYAQLENYTTDENRGNYYIVTVDDEKHLYLISADNSNDTVAVDLGIYPAKGPQGEQGIQGLKGEKGDSVIGPRGLQGIQGAPGRGIDSLAGIDASDYEATFTDPTVGGLVVATTSADVDFGAQGTQTIDFSFKYKVPTDYYDKEEIDAMLGDLDDDVASAIDAAETSAKDYADELLGDIPEGPQGPEGPEGPEGNGIASIAKTSTAGLVDTYTITYTDGNTATFTVTNGQNGTNGTNGTNGVGITSIEKTSTLGLVDTYTITFTNGDTSTFDVTNGQNGIDGSDGEDGTDGVGIAGISKTSTAGLVDTYTITYTDGDTSTFTVTNGADGAPGAQGPAGPAAVSENLLINPDFTINQRGAKNYSGSSTAKVYSVDRWYIPQKSSDDEFVGAYRAPLTGSPYDNIEILTMDANSINGLEQTLENFKALKGKKVTFTSKVHFPAQNTSIRLYVKDGVGTTYSSAHAWPTDGEFSVTRTIDASATEVTVGYELNYTGASSPSSSIEVRWAKLELGEQFTGFNPPEYGTEITKCQRFYWASHADITQNLNTSIVGASSSTSSAYFSISTPIMRITPTLILGRGVDKVNALGLHSSVTIYPSNVLLATDGYAMNNNLALNLTKTGGTLFEEDKPYKLNLHQGIALDAEMY